MAAELVRITGDTHIHAKKVVIDGIDPRDVEYVVRKFWNPEGVIYEAEHMPTGTKVRDWATNGGPESALRKCVNELDPDTVAR